MAISAVAAVTSIQITLSKAASDAAVSLYRTAITVQFFGTLCAIITDAVQIGKVTTAAKPVSSLLLLAIRHSY